MYRVCWHICPNLVYSQGQMTMVPAHFCLLGASFLDPCLSPIITPVTRTCISCMTAAHVHTACVLHQQAVVANASEHAFALQEHYGESDSRRHVPHLHEDDAGTPEQTLSKMHVRAGVAHTLGSSAPWLPRQLSGSILVYSSEVQL